MTAAALVASTTWSAAQAPAPRPAADAASLEQAIATCRHLLADWAGLTRYGSEDAEVPPPSRNESRVVFLGDQITEGWGASAGGFFPGRPYFNRGVDGQTTPQMLVRFRQDVITLKPRVVVILGGSNDVARATGPATRGTFADNVMSMTELAHANHIRVVLASITPVCDCGSEQTARRSPVRIADWNEWLQQYAAESGAVYLDYYAALADGRELRRDLTRDGLLPNDAGYAVMARLAERAIGEALAAR
jgi:lysophospholipase L1-like esterase